MSFNKEAFQTQESFLDKWLKQFEILRKSGEICHPVRTVVFDAPRRDETGKVQPQKGYVVVSNTGNWLSVTHPDELEAFVQQIAIMKTAPIPDEIERIARPLIGMTFAVKDTSQLFKSQRILSRRAAMVVSLGQHMYNCDDPHCGWNEIVGKTPHIS